METQRKPQLLVRLTLFSVLFSQMLAWPLFKAPFASMPLEGAIDSDEDLLTLDDTDILPNAYTGNGRSARHAKEILTSEYKRFLGQLPAKRHVESFIGKRDSNNISEDNGTKKRQVDEKNIDELALKRLLESLGIRDDDTILEILKKIVKRKDESPQWWVYLCSYFILTATIQLFK